MRSTFVRTLLSSVSLGWLGFAMVVSAPVPAVAQGYPERMESDYGAGGDDPYYGDEGGPFSLRTGLGFTADPDAFLLGFEADYRLAAEGFSLGGLVQLGIDDDYTIVSPVAYGRYTFNWGRVDADLERLDTFGQGGLGFTWWDVDRRGRGDDDDAEFLLNFGIGAEYRLTEHVSAGTFMLFNIIPSEIFDERFYFSWEVATLRYRF